MADVLDSGRFVLGEKVEEFEEAFAAYCAAAFAVGVSSGTDALRLALLACGVRPGHEVITVSYTCVPTVSAICSIGATPVFVDIDPGSYGIRLTNTSTNRPEPTMLRTSLRVAR